MLHFDLDTGFCSRMPRQSEQLIKLFAQQIGLVCRRSSFCSLASFDSIDVGFCAAHSAVY